MRLTQRLVLTSLLVLTLVVTSVLAFVGRPLQQTIVEGAAAELAREAALVGTLWRPGVDADSLADAAAATLGHPVLLVRPDGLVAGDSRLSAREIARAGRLAETPEIVAALRDTMGWVRERRAIAGTDELLVAVRVPQGVVRVVASLHPLGDAFARARRDLFAIAALALVVAALLALLTAQRLAYHLAELREATQALAAGDLSRRPSLSAPGAIGDLASAVYRLAEQLSGRLTALKAEEALLAALAESLAEGVVAVDRRRQVVRLNATGRRLLDVKVPVPFPAEHLPRERQLREALEGALAGDASDIPELALGERVLTLSARPLPDGGAVLALFDLTPVKRLEAVRRDFVANVSHELKTPLTVIGGFAETLQDETLPPDQRRYFAATIRTNTARMQRIVDDLLDLSRIESGGWVPQPQRVGLRAAVDDAFGAASAAAARLGTRLTLDVADGADTVYADPTALRQVLGNLVDNAVRHTPGGEVRVFARPVPDGVLVGVRDTGCGIPAEHLPRIFERFYRVDAARSRQAGGTGLGLAIVRHLVEAHGGHVSAESRVGGGTTITAYFPAPER
ncbi:MAG TPA: ATP-binding protein [Gemmatimonadaceae bacterium]|nr:ATP-binding protein [Gemmatimonadaceae bacterium]